METVFIIVLTESGPAADKTTSFLSYGTVYFMKNTHDVSAYCPSFFLLILLPDYCFWLSKLY